MKLVQRNGFLYGSTVCIFFLILTLSNAIEQLDLTPESLKSINLTNAIIPHSRVKREHGSCVTGMAIDGATSAGSASTLNAEANSGGGRGRGKRSIEAVESKNETEAIRNKRSPPAKRPSFREILQALLKSMPKIGKKSKKQHRRGWFATRTQELFDRINHNPSFAQGFLESQSVQSSEYLTSRIIVNPHAVTCHELCNHYPGVRYALVGFCTPDYCQCFTEYVWDKDPWGLSGDKGWGWDNIGKEKERSCNKKKVFDPVRLTCRDPRKTELCSDRPAHGWSEKH